MPESTARPPLLDRAIGVFSPKWAAKRAAWRGYSRSLLEAQSVYNATYQSRLDRGWPTTVGYTGANNPLNRYRLTRLRDRAREMDRNNAVCTGMLDRTAENIIGHGFRLQPATTDKDFNKRVSEWWDGKDGGDGEKDKLDVTGTMSFGELEWLLCRSLFRDGDVGVGLVKDAGNPRLQAVEGDLIDTLYGGYNLEKNILDGMKLNKWGRPVAFYTLTIGMDGKRTPSAFPASDFIFLARKKRITIYRGEPCFAQTSTLTDMIDAYLEALVVAARVGASQAMIIETINPANQQAGLPTAINTQGQSQAVETVEPGSIRRLKPGEKAYGFTPTMPGMNFEQLVNLLMRIQGLILGMPLELLLLDWSRSNLSSARGALQQFHRFCRRWQRLFISKFHSRVYRWRLSCAVRDGELDVPEAIADSFWAHKWITPGFPFLDPLKDVQAALLAIDACLDDGESLTHERGGDFDRILVRRAAQIKRMKKAGIPLVHSTMTRDPLAAVGGIGGLGGAPGAAGSAQPGNQPADDPDDEDEEPDEDEIDEDQEAEAD